MTPLLPAPRGDFIGLDDKIHLATGGEPPLLHRHRDAFEAFAADKARGMDGYANHWRVVDAVRAQLAPMAGLVADEVGLAEMAALLDLGVRAAGAGGEALLEAVRARAVAPARAHGILGFWKK